LIQFTGADTRTKQYIGHAQARCGTVHYEPCKDNKTPRDLGYINNMVAGPYWSRIKQALSVQGDWSISDDEALQKLIKQGAASDANNANNKQGSQSKSNTVQQSSSPSTLWILFIVCLLVATAVLVYMYILAAQGRNSDLPLTLCCVLPSHKAV
jgi:hypothetical protein